jgi:hypothetical protein
MILLFFVLICNTNIAAWSCKNYCKNRLSSVTRNEWDLWVLPAAIFGPSCKDTYTGLCQKSNRLAPGREDSGALQEPKTRAKELSSALRNYPARYHSTFICDRITQSLMTFAVKIDFVLLQQLPVQIVHFPSEMVDDCII